MILNKILYRIVLKRLTIRMYIYSILTHFVFDYLVKMAVEITS